MGMFLNWLACMCLLFLLFFSNVLARHISRGLSQSLSKLVNMEFAAWSLVAVRFVQLGPSPYIMGTMFC
ncbi:hypothetical protein Peur_005508 [Populus x canadensis]